MWSNEYEYGTSEYLPREAKHVMHLNLSRRCAKHAAG